MIIGAKKRLKQRQQLEKEYELRRAIALGNKNARRFVEMQHDQVGPTPLYPPTDVTVSIDTLAEEGVTLRIPAGGVTPITVTDIGDWHYLSAILSMTVPGNKMALALDVVKSSPGQDSDVVTYDVVFDQPLYIKGLLGRFDNQSLEDSLYYLKEETADVTFDSPADINVLKLKLPLPYNDHPAVHQYVGAVVNTLSCSLPRMPKTDPRLTAILPNTAEMLSIASGDDRTLHQVPHTLGVGDVAQSADLAEYLNDVREAGDETTQLRLSSRSDCVVTLRLHATRQYRAEGVGNDAADDPLPVSPWTPVSLAPLRPAGHAPVVTVRAEAQADGAARVGLRETASATQAQGIRLPPRTGLLQPFVLSQTGLGPRSFSGVWLCLSGPPEQAEALKVKITQFDPITQSEGEVLATATAAFTDRQMDLTAIGGGVFVQWVAFDQVLEIDTPDIGAHFALLVSAASGPIPLLETRPTLPGLMPALSRDFARSNRWKKRSFGAADKVLMFELGEVADQLDATLIVQSGETIQTVFIGSQPTEMSIDILWTETLILKTDRALQLDMFNVTTQSAVENIGD